MTVVTIRPDIYWIGVNDRTTDLFEGLWPIEHAGVSYNSYLICDEKTALIDLAKAFKSDEYLSQIAQVAALEEIDYIVINHMEPDHSGLLSLFLRLAPRAVLVGTEKTREFLAGFYGITENIQVVKDGEALSLGKHTLQFVAAPFVHWPETMMTYEVTQKVLFACDAFGGYGALRGAIFDDQCVDMRFYEQEALRYYANIVAKFSGPVLRAIKKLEGVPVDVIAPSHGLVWRKDPQRIVDLYARWARYATEPAEPEITLVYGSMYGSTEKMMNVVAQGISSEDVSVEVFDAARTHPSYILPSLWTKSGVMIGAPTYEVSLFPPVALVLDMAARKRIVNKKAAWFGSYGWSGGALKELQGLIEPLKWELVETLEFRGQPTKADLTAAEAFGARFARAVKG
jgi:flavorubredoxin